MYVMYKEDAFHSFPHGMKNNIKNMNFISPGTLTRCLLLKIQSSYKMAN